MELDKNKKLALAAAAAVLLVIAGAALLTQTSTSQNIDCQQKYNQTLQGELEPGEIPEQCRPVPEDVEKQLLAQALAEKQ